MMALLSILNPTILLMPEILLYLSKIKRKEA
jgi:hypothetical protein